MKKMLTNLFLLCFIAVQFSVAIEVAPSACASCCVCYATDCPCCEDYDFENLPPCDCDAHVEVRESYSYDIKYKRYLAIPILHNITIINIGSTHSYSASLVDYHIRMNN